MTEEKPTVIGIVEEGDLNHTSLWWIMSDGSKLSGCPKDLLLQARAVYLNKQTLHTLNANKSCIQYFVAVYLHNFVYKIYDFLTLIQRKVGWPRHK